VHELFGVLAKEVLELLWFRLGTCETRTLALHFLDFLGGVRGVRLEGSQHEVAFVALTFGYERCGRVPRDPLLRGSGRFACELLVAQGRWRLGVLFGAVVLLQRRRGEFASVVAGFPHFRDWRFQGLVVAAGRDDVRPGVLGRLRRLLDMCRHGFRSWLVREESRPRTIGITRSLSVRIERR
jgi:hypothetical protein